MLSTNDVIMCVCTFVISIISVLAGVGGGGMYTSSLLIIYKFHITEAIPISITLTFSASLTNTIYFVINKNNKRLTNYPILIILMPFLSCGSFIGNILLKIMPKIITVVVMISITLYSIYKSFVKLCQLRLQENQNGINSNDIEMISQNDQDNEDSGDCLNEVDLNNINNRDSCLIIFVYFMLLVVVTICEGSFSIGRRYVQMCGNLYIITCISQIIVTILLAIACFVFVQKDKYVKTQSNYNFNVNDIEITQHNYIVLASAGTIVSIVGTYTGLGGGMIINPILLFMGLTPSAVIATSCIFIWLSTLSSIVNFVIDNSIKWKYSAMFSVCTIFGTIVGLTLYNMIVKKFKKESILVMCLIAISVIIIGLLVTNVTMSKEINNINFSPLCTK